MRKLALALLLALAPSAARAGLLSAQGLIMTDTSGAQRTTFSNNEKVGMSVVVNNGAASLNRITFQFDIVAPDGATTFRHAGNAVPGTVGNAAAQVTGVPVSGFFRSPGVYTLKAMASLDGVTLTQTMNFTVSSPNILLIYPPNGAMDLADNPIVFQWYSSGANSYRVTVADNPSLYNAPFVQTVTGAASLTYPANPTDPRQRLAAGQMYYWGVEGLDVSGNVIARSETPSSFSVKGAALTRDLAVTDIVVNGTAGADGSIPFRVTVKNQGSAAETGVQMSFTVGGLAAPGAPVALPSLAAGESKDFDLPAPIPVDQNSSLAIACVQIFDDNVPNNCKTLTVNRASSGGSGTGFATGELTVDQIWAAIRELLRERGIDLDDYVVTGMEGSLTREELMALLDQLRSGSASATISGPPMTTTPPPSTGSGSTTVPPPSSKTTPVDESGAPAASEEPAGQTAAGKEWSGTTDIAAQASRAFTITSAAVWKKLWSHLSDQALPVIDFKTNMIVGVIGGKSEKADNITLEDVQTTLDGVIVRYHHVVHDSSKSKNRTTVPYVLRVIPRSSLQVKFQLVKENNDE